MTDFGLDTGSALDLDPTFAAVTGPRAVAICVARRFLTPRGWLAYAPDFGLDVRDYLALPLSVGERAGLASRLAAEAEKDERVLQASVEVLQERDALRITIVLSLAEGPFRFVLAIDRVSAALSEGS